MIAAGAALGVAFGLLAGAEVELNATASSESRAGQAPLVVNTTPRAFVAQVITPGAELDINHRVLTLRAGYGARLLWQDPKPAVSEDLLILHTLNFTLTGRVTPRTTLSLVGTGSYGEPDYIALPQLLGTTQASLPQVVRIASSTIRGIFRHRVDRRFELDLGLQFFGWKMMNELIVEEGQLRRVTSQAQGVVEPSAGYRITARDMLALRGAAGWGVYSTGATVLSLTPMLVWDRRLSRADTIRLGLGVNYSRSVGMVTGAATMGFGDLSAFLPTGFFEIDGFALRRSGLTIRGTLTTGVELFLDPVLGRGDPRGYLRATMALASGPVWSAFARGDFATPVRTTALAMDYLETTAAFSLSARRQFPDAGFALEFGGRWADRAPALASPNFHFSQRQLWAFLSISATTRVSRRTSRN